VQGIHRGPRAHACRRPVIDRGWLARKSSLPAKYGAKLLYEVVLGGNGSLMITIAQSFKFFILFMSEVGAPSHDVGESLNINVLICLDGNSFA
jgi:hypothetical protein